MWRSFILQISSGAFQSHLGTLNLSYVARIPNSDKSERILRLYLLVARVNGSISYLNVKYIHSPSRRSITESRERKCLFISVIN